MCFHSPKVFCRAKIHTFEQKRRRVYATYCTKKHAQNWVSGRGLVSWLCGILSFQSRFIGSHSVSGRRYFVSLCDGRGRRSFCIMLEYLHFTVHLSQTQHLFRFPAALKCNMSWMLGIIGVSINVWSSQNKKKIKKNSEFVWISSRNCIECAPFTWDKTGRATLELCAKVNHNVWQVNCPIKIDFDFVEPRRNCPNGDSS